MNTNPDQTVSFVLRFIYLVCLNELTGTRLNCCTLRTVWGRTPMLPPNIAPVPNVPPSPISVNPPTFIPDDACAEDEDRDGTETIHGKMLAL